MLKVMLVDDEVTILEGFKRLFDPTPICVAHV